MFRKAAGNLGGIILSMLLSGICAANDSTAGAASPTQLGHQLPAEGLEAWINLRVIQRLTHHTTVVITAVVLFWFVGFLVQRRMRDNWMKRCVLLVDELVLLSLLVYFVY